MLITFLEFCFWAWAHIRQQIRCYQYIKYPQQKYIGWALKYTYKYFYVRYQANKQIK